jgi:hypothetical protein
LIADFRKGLSQTGFVEGNNVVVEYHWLDGHYDEIPAIISDAVRRGVAVIATPASTPASLAAKAATAKIPIVFGVGEDPVALGLVASFAQPGGNATGINFFASEIDAKRLGLMHELLLKAHRIAVLLNPANAATAEATSNALKKPLRVSAWNYCFSAPARPPRLTTPLLPLLLSERMLCSLPPTRFSAVEVLNLSRSQHATDYRPAPLRATLSRRAC